MIDEMPKLENNITFLGTDLKYEDIKESVKSFIIGFKLENEEMPHYQNKIDQMKETGIIYNMQMNCEHLHQYDKGLYNKLIKFPTEVLPIFDLVVQEKILENGSEEELEKKVTVFPYGLKDTAPMRNLGPSDLDHLVSIKGMIIRSSNIVPELKEAFFECTNCYQNERVALRNGLIKEPSKCKVCNKPFTMQIIYNRSVYVDKQIIKLQETPDAIPEGETPHSVTLISYSDLVDIARPGDRVDITGIYRASPQRVNAIHRKVNSIYR